MIKEYLKDSTKHKHPILITSASVIQGASEIFYCIRKHQAEDFFSITFVCIEGDQIDTWIEEGFTSSAEALEIVEEVTAMNHNNYVFREVLSKILENDPNVLRVTPNLTILYLDSGKNLCVSKRTDNIFEMPGFYPTQEIINLFTTTEGELRV